MDPNQVWEHIEAHPYATIMALSMVNGRIAAFAVGPFISLGYINPFIAYLIFTVMDFLGDTLYFLAGRLGHIGGRFLIKEKWHGKLSELCGKTEAVMLRILFWGKVSGVA